MDVFPPSDQILNPYPFYAQMRKFHPIVYDDKNKVWGIFCYDDIQSVLTNHKFFSSDVQKLMKMQQAEMKQQEQNNKRER